MKPFTRLMKALSDPNRVRIVKLLEDRTLCVCEIQKVLGLAQPTVSSHLKILEEAGLVDRARQGTWILYSQAQGSPSEPVRTMLAQLRRWLADDPALKEMIAALPEASCLRASALARAGEAAAAPASHPA